MAVSVMNFTCQDNFSRSGLFSFEAELKFFKDVINSLKLVVVAAVLVYS